MLKSSIIILLSFVLMMSILAPSVLSLLDDTNDTVMVDVEEDDDSEKSETENEDSEEKHAFFFYSLTNACESFVSKNLMSSVSHIDDITAHVLEIQLPPPETSI